ncbi:MAG: septal ring lytic transglycosylase RlpA family protein [Hyphomicrobium sp.]
MLTAMSRVFAGRISSRQIVAALLASVLPVLIPAAAQAKTPGKTYCFNGVCHQVKSLAETVSLVGREESLTSSFYDDCKRDRFNPCGLTSSGEKMRANDADNAASPIYPDGTVLLIRNPATGQAASVRVNNAGPYWGKRRLDVSRGTAEKLGFKNKGIAKLQVKVISAPTKQEARYKKNRRYDAVPGALGTFASLEAAQGAMVIAMGKTATPLRVATADMLTSETPVAFEGETPADGLRAAARRALGLEPNARRIAPSTLTAEALYGLIRKPL